MTCLISCVLRNQCPSPSVGITSVGTTAVGITSLDGWMRREVSSASLQRSDLSFISKVDTLSHHSLPGENHGLHRGIHPNEIY